MKILALDLGDAWVGSALSDELGITARPYQTVKAKELIGFITNVISVEPISIIVIGYPKTMGGKDSEQTKKVVAQKESLEQQFPQITWALWDERLSSRQAAGIKKTKTKEDKIASHSIAAAVILTGYLMFRSNTMN